VAEKLRTAVFDIGAHCALQRLITGPFKTSEELTLVEEALRAIVLHDDAVLEPNLCLGMAVADALNDAEVERTGELERDKRGLSSFSLIQGKGFTPGQEYVIGFTPIELYGLLRARESVDVPDVELSPSLQQLIESESRSKPGSRGYETYEESLRVVFGALRDGGSIVCETKFIRRAVETASMFPHQLFAKLDQDWAEFAKNLNTAGPLVPPVLSIVLTRSASRDKIPAIVRDLRDEWAVARSKVWVLLDALKKVPTLAQAKEIERELKQTSEYFSPLDTEDSSRPTQVLWDVFVSGLGGALVAAISGGKPTIGAATSAVGRAVGEVQKNPNFGQILFGRGGFDLAGRVRRELNQLERDRLLAFLNESERKALGFSK
jgi:hypothetical protein